MPPRSPGYHSSEEKDILRDHFDLPLLRQLYQRKGEPLSYFGLPGADALDIKAWQECIGEVGAVERDENNLERLELVLETRFPDIQFKTHWGEVDKVILTNRGKRRDRGGQSYRPRVGNNYKRDIQGRVWGFDIVYLDYFGKFLPKGNIKRAKARTEALRKLFNTDRVDAWQSWILIITVEDRWYNSTDRDTLRQFLRDTQEGVSLEIRQILDFLLSDVSTNIEEGVRLIHGTTAVLVSDSAKANSITAKPRGTVMYTGSNNSRMVHMAFEFEPNPAVLSGPSDLLRLLQAPILRPKDPHGVPWVELLEEQCPGVTRHTVSQCLDFLDPQIVSQIISDLN